ncbi:hypothetical protein PENTCL1PPCAC_8455 [Pristionchus entomophagus]|uniref:AAA protein n=1 Tax=Pristionchus entomophagus TaxID=358040 RepID=A0AAV5T1R7_9BILA|nr:hypothetical protein PENTCL1PPCAC_8455 [Pristionchus entomophagus]
MEEPPHKKKPQPISTRFVPALFIGRNNEKVYYISGGIVADTIDFESAEACTSLSVDSLCDIKITSHDNDTQELSFVPISEDRADIFMRVRPVASAEDYRTYVLRALVMGSRALEYAFSSATVIGVLNEESVKVSLTSCPFSPTDSVFLRTESAEIFECTVVEALEYTAILRTRAGKQPASISHCKSIQILSKAEDTVISDILPLFYTTCPVENWNLLERLYGKPDDTVDTVSSPTSTPLIHLSEGKTILKLNEEQAEAVGLYNNSPAACPAFAVEGPRGSGKTSTAAAMAATFRGEGLQVLLAPADDAVLMMALSIKKLDVGDRKVIQISSIASAAHGHEDGQFSQKYGIVLASVDAIFRRSTNDALQEQLKSDVTRIVVDDASSLSEAALNAIILCFPRAQIVLIGESEKLKPPRHVKSDVFTELAARSALDLVKRKNLPVVRLREVYPVAS